MDGTLKVHATSCVVGKKIESLVPTAMCNNWELQVCSPSPGGSHLPQQPAVLSLSQYGDAKLHELVLFFHSMKQPKWETVRGQVYARVKLDSVQCIHVYISSSDKQNNRSYLRSYTEVMVTFNA